MLITFPPTVLFVGIFSFSLRKLPVLPIDSHTIVLLITNFSSLTTRLFSVEKSVDEM